MVRRNCICRCRYRHYSFVYSTLLVHRLFANFRCAGVLWRVFFVCVMLLMFFSSQCVFFVAVFNLMYKFQWTLVVRPHCSCMACRCFILIFFVIFGYRTPSMILWCVIIFGIFCVELVLIF